MQNLERRPSGIYVARLAIPIRLRAAIGATAFIASTGTRNLAMAKILANEQLATWRRQIFELERLSLEGTAMNGDSIVKIADGHPILRSGSYLPLLRAAAVLGLSAEDLLRQAADGHLSMFCRLADVSGYLTQASEFEPDDPDLGTVVVPGIENRPTKSELHRAFGVYMIEAEEAKPLASILLTTGEPSSVITFELVGSVGRYKTFVPTSRVLLGSEHIEFSTAELEGLRKELADSISRPVLEAARAASHKPREVNRHKSATLYLDAVGTYCKDYLPRKLSSPKEVARIHTGLALFAEFEGNMAIGKVDTDMLRHFRDHHLAKMPANENRVRIKFGTTTMAASIDAVRNKDWPRMSAGERDLRMQWLSRMFKWLHSQKWINDDPSTVLRGESVLTKAERTRAEIERKPREEFTPEEVAEIFSAPVFQIQDATPTKAGTFRTFQPFHYWLPLLGLFTGARIGELCQLHLADIQQSDGVWLIDINQNSPDKSLKNTWSARRVPLHPKLLELGFVEWQRRLRAEGYQRLFPELSWNPINRYAKEPIRFMTEFLRNMKLPRDGTKVFHSFRHGINNGLHKSTAMPEIMRKRVLGHEPGDGVNERHYLSDSSPSEILRHLSTLEFSLPSIQAFDCGVGLQAINDSLRRKNRGRGAYEAIGAVVG